MEIVRGAVVFDLDGTLYDVTSIVHLVEGDQRDFDAFHAASIDCPPYAHVLEAAHAARAAGQAVIVITGRSAVWRDLTLTWFSRHDVPFDLMLMRYTDDFRPDHVVKDQFLADIVADGYTVLEAWEDSAMVAENWRAKGILVHDVSAT